MKRFPLVWTIVLNFNARELTCQCLESLLESTYPNLKVLLVDNASTDNTVQAVRTDFPRVEVIQNPKNYFFAQGNNIGMKFALNQGAEYIFILNNDTRVDPECISALASFLQDQPECAACQPLLLQMQKPNRIASAGCRVALSGRARDLYYGLPIDDIARQPFEVCGVTGGAFLVRAAALQKAGGFCKYFKMYFEDVDLSLRLQEHGYALYCIPAAKVRHHVSASTQKKGVFFHTYYTERNSYLVVLRNFPITQILRSYIFKIPASGASFVFNLLKGNFSYSLAVLLGSFYGMMAAMLFLPLRYRELISGKKKRFPFWERIEKNILYP